MHVYTFLNFIYAYISFKINSFKDIRFASMYVTSIINDINFVSVLHSIISINYLIRISKNTISCIYHDIIFDIMLYKGTKIDT